MNQKKTGLPQGYGANPRGQPAVNPHLQQPRVAQPKLVNTSQMKNQPVAPPVYRPQPVPRALQTKMASGQQPPAGQSPRQPVAPPVYRPEAKKIVQPKMAAQSHKPPQAPPVYRPEQRKVLQPKLMSQPRQPPAPPPAYRPETKTVQLKMFTARAPTPVYRLGSSTIQRKVIEKIVSGKKIYYSDKDPAKKFNTREEAEVHELTLGLPRVAEGTRGPTLYTYTHTKSHCQIDSRGIPQGPHTMGHAATSGSLSGFGSGQNIYSTFAEQVPSPDAWYQMVINEKGPDAFDGKSQVSKGLVRAHQDYTNLYNATTLLIKMGNDDKARYNIGLLMQLSPYGTYCWKSPTKASNKSLKNKGEDANIMDDSNIDKGGRWSKPEAYKAFIEDRRLLEDDDFDDSSSSSSDEYPSDIDMYGNSSSDDDDNLLVLVKHLGINYWFSDDEIPANGDCFFNTLIAMRLNNGNSVQQLRNLAANNGGQANIATPGIWANIQDITALANQLGIRIRVLSIAIHGNAVNQDSTYGAGGPVYVIGHIHGGHYTPLR